MSTRESLTFAENLTLVVMDVEPGAGEGVVWLELRDEHGHLKSSVLRAGESFSYGERGEGLSLTVTRIYAGGERDLVNLEILSGEVVERSGEKLSDNSRRDRDKSGPSGDSSLLNWGLAAVLVLVLAAWVYLAVRPKGRRR